MIRRDGGDEVDGVDGVRMCCAVHYWLEDLVPRRELVSRWTEWLSGGGGRRSMNAAGIKLMSAGKSRMCCGKQSMGDGRQSTVGGWERSAPKSPSMAATTSRMDAGREWRPEASEEHTALAEQEE